jgi:hypothetical protein
MIPPKVMALSCRARRSNQIYFSVKKGAIASLDHGNLQGNLLNFYEIWQYFKLSYKFCPNTSVAGSAGSGMSLKICHFFHSSIKNCTTAGLNRAWFLTTLGRRQLHSLFGWLVADGWCWFVLREEYCWLVAGGWFVLLVGG